MEWIQNQFKDDKKAAEFTKGFSLEVMQNAYGFHKTMPQHEKTPLYSLTERSREFGLGALFVKDEAPRFGLDAFKGLGVSYAMARYFAGKLNQDISDSSFNALLEAVSQYPAETFATATEGNHGKGVAWGTKLFNQKGKVFLPKGAAESRIRAVTDFGAEAKVTDINYDDTVQYASDQANGNGWVLLQDTAWEGYEEIPTHIMQGYTTIISEITEQFESAEWADISHVILQAGVGSFAGAITAALYNLTDGRPPKIIIVEPKEADPLFRSADSELGGPVRVLGDMNTVMAGLSCGEPNPIGWNILKSAADCFVSCDDEISDKGIRLLGRPAGDDPAVTSGASGAVTAGFLSEVMTNDRYSDLKENIQIDKSSKVLVINTEGATDPDHYLRVMDRQ